jgi:protein SCO1
MTQLRLTVALSLAFVAVVLGMFYYSVTRPAVLSDEQLRDIGVFVLPAPREIAPFELVAHTGRPFTLDDLKGRWSFIFFGFTNCPDICPTSMAVMAQAERQLEAEAPESAGQFQGVLVTVDPERDDQDTLATYVQAFSEDFVGVRGDLPSTAAFATQVNAAFAMVPGDNGGYQVDHTANIVIVNPRGHYHGFARTPHNVDTIVEAYRSLSRR